MTEAQFNECIANVRRVPVREPARSSVPDGRWRAWLRGRCLYPTAEQASVLVALEATRV